MGELKAPFPWFGGKSRIADEVWSRFGDVPNYVEPFAGSAAVLLRRPDDHERKTETINDFDGFVANFWRALQSDPDAVAHHADWPVNENDLHARHAWLLGQKETLRPRLEGDPEWCDARIAGWWAWGASCWIGSGWCSGKGPWAVEDGQLVHLGDQGRGVNRKLVHLGDQGRGVNRKRVHLGSQGRGLRAYLAELAFRLRYVRVCCGDWSRITGPSVLFPGVDSVGVFLDPPYADTANRDADLYMEDSTTVAHDVRRWAIEAGKDPRVKVALAGYEGEHEMPDDWEVLEWRSSGAFIGKGRGKAEDNRHKERIWFSPACARVDPLAGQLRMFDTDNTATGGKGEG